MSRWLLPLTIPASWAYRAAIAWRNRRYDAARAAPTSAGIARIDRPVISVGNLTAGGTGKTPHVMWIVEQLLESGHKPVIAMRGYKAPSGRPGDEEQEYRDRFDDSVPVLAQPRRARALREFFARHENTTFDCVILDDGFQHRQVARDLDLVLIDATQPTFTDRLLPAGRLREPLASLRRADAVIVTRAADIDPVIAGRIERHHGRPPLAWTNHGWSGLTVHAAAGADDVPLDWLRGRRLVTMFGVGNPNPLRQAARQAGAVILRDVPVADHQSYDRPMLDRIRPMLTGAEGLLISPKDWVKLREVVTSWAWPMPIIVPVVRLAVVAGEADLKRSILQAAARRHTVTPTSADT